MPPLRAGTDHQNIHSTVRQGRQKRSFEVRFGPDPDSPTRGTHNKSEESDGQKIQKWPLQASRMCDGMESLEPSVGGSIGINDGVEARAKKAVGWHLMGKHICKLVNDVIL